MARVSIEFAGLVLAVIPKKKDKATMLLLDAEASGGPPHHAVMLVRDHSGLVGRPDFTVTGPATGNMVDEYAGWFIRGNVRLVGDDLPAWTDPVVGLSRTQDVATVAAATKALALDLVPLAATVILENGELASIGVANLYDFHFEDSNGKEQRVYNKPVELTDRISCTFADILKPFKVAFDGIDGGRRVVTVSHLVGAPIIISNLTAGSSQGQPHYQAFYDSIDAGRRPVIQRYLADGTAVDPPDNTDECMNGYMLES